MSDQVSEVLALEDRRLKAMNDGDAAAMRVLIRDDHVHVTATGLVTDVDGAVRMMTSTPLKVEPRTPQVRIFDDVAVLTGPQVIVGPNGAMHLFVTQVATRVDGEWKFVLMQGTARPT